LRINAVVQARMSSERFPGKVLAPLAGRPVLLYLLERLRLVNGLDGVVVATSTGPDDDAIAAFCETHGVPCSRGSLGDVAGRFLATTREHDLDAFVRVSADSPLLDSRLVEQGVALFRSSTPDIVSNVFPRSYPPGQSVEVVDTAAFAAAYPEMSDPDEREHLTLFFYRRPDRYRIEAFGGPLDNAVPGFAIDVPADLDRIAAIVGAMRRPHVEYSYQELIELARAVERGSGG
jgi:spore coat polysaccharide biosynthesis protein SpsF